jgi:hypothetical protein
MIEELRGVHEATTSPFLRDPNDLARLFQENARKWKEETWMLSSITDKVQDPAYVGIIALGPQVVPLILAELQTEPGYWFWALQMITREDPVLADADFDEAVEAWLEWGRAKGYLPAEQPLAFPEE